MIMFQTPDWIGSVGVDSAPTHSPHITPPAAAGKICSIFLKKEMKITLAVDAGVNWSEKELRHKGLINIFEKKNLGPEHAVRLQMADF